MRDLLIIYDTKLSTGRVMPANYSATWLRNKKKFTYYPKLPPYLQFTPKLSLKSLSNYHLFTIYS